MSPKLSWRESDTCLGEQVEKGWPWTASAIRIAKQGRGWAPLSSPTGWLSNFRPLLTCSKGNPRGWAGLQHTQVSWSVNSEQKLRWGRASRFSASDLLESLLAGGHISLRDPGSSTENQTGPWCLSRKSSGKGLPPTFLTAHPLSPLAFRLRMQVKHFCPQDWSLLGATKHLKHFSASPQHINDKLISTCNVISPFINHF